MRPFHRHIRVRVTESRDTVDSEYYVGHNDVSNFTNMEKNVRKPTNETKIIVSGVMTRYSYNGLPFVRLCYFHTINYRHNFAFVVGRT